uniref:Uncharacterized protein n=1 Tax=Timema poppense TaxID=170557 RepID=A0A7R9GUS9_TIMPO|nr:unnamed protein product [Timema poppensis]
MNIKVLPNVSLDKDHRLLLVADLKSWRRGCQIVKQLKRIRIWKLSQVEERMSFQARVRGALPKDDITEQNRQNFKKCVVEEVEQICTTGAILLCAFFVDIIVWYKAGSINFVDEQVPIQEEELDPIASKTRSETSV